MPTRHVTMLVAMFVVLVACSRRANETSTAAAGPSPPKSGIQYDSEKILNIYSWTDYIAPDTIANFEKETGIRIRYDTYDSNEVLETKLFIGHTNYDIVIPSGQFFERQLTAGVYRELDKSALPNLVNLDPDVLGWLAVHDPDNLHAIPYMWATTGLGYNVDKVRARLGPNLTDSWALLFDPANAAKLKDCGISMIDSPVDVFDSVIIYLGRDPNRNDPADITAASEVLRKIRPYIRTIDTLQYFSDLAEGNACMTLGWSGDIGQARRRAAESKTGVTLAYLLPREGSTVTVDMIGIPKDAPHPHNAEVWMNYLMRPEVMADITNFIKYPNGNLGSFKLLDDATKNDETMYPDRSIRARLVTPKALPLEYSRLLGREWTRFRTGY
jgi:putrescine transport system substrate-binding protein